MKIDQVVWIAADWGTTNLRCWAMSKENDVLFRARSDQGMSAISSGKGDFEAALLELIHPWLQSDKRMPVFACGMVGAKQGWAEAPYVAVPCSPTTERIVAPTKSPDIEVFIHAGVKQLAPADVMRGEETQIAGMLAGAPDFNGLVCLPGTHTKWATVGDGLIQNFHTYLTGELFTLLAEQSVLRLTLAGEGWNEAAFLEALHSTTESPESFLSKCFSLRAEALLNDLDGIEARSRLSGYLIGLELSSVVKQIKPTDLITIIGSEDLVRIYQLALEALEYRATTVSNETAILAGLGRRKS